MKKFTPVSRSVPLQISHYVNGWITRDADQVVASMADNGTYIDRPHPTVSKSEMKHHLEQIAWVNFPDMTFETLNLFGCRERQTYAWEWALHASQCAVRVSAQSSRAIHCEGVDILTLDGDGNIVKAVCHIDRKTLWDSVVS